MAAKAGGVCGDPTLLTSPELKVRWRDKAKHQNALSYTILAAHRRELLVKAVEEEGFVLRFMVP